MYFLVESSWQLGDHHLCYTKRATLEQVGKLSHSNTDKWRIKWCDLGESDSQLLACLMALIA